VSTAVNIIRANYRQSVSKPPEGTTDVEIAWSEYELRRRVHFSLELLLEAFTDSLIELTKGTVGEVLSAWVIDPSIPPLIAKIVGTTEIPFSSRIENIEALMDIEGFLNHPPDPSQARGLNPPAKAFYAVLLLDACRIQTSALRVEKRIPDRKSYMEKAFRILEESGSRPYVDVLHDLMIQVVIEPHMRTTLRKMGTGQQCSLRFYPEGDVLRPTGVAVSAGYSGDRLGNVMQMLADLGHLLRENGAFSLSARGNEFVKTLETAS